jgi:tape measure domain-containing protein
MVARPSDVAVKITAEDQTAAGLQSAMARIQALEAQLQSASGGMNRAAAGARGLDGAISGIVGTVGRLGGILAGLGLGAIFVQAARDALAAGMEIEQLTRRYQFLAGSAKAAQEQMAFVARTSQSFGMSEQQGQQSFASFLGLARSGVINTDSAQRLFTGLNAFGSQMGVGAQAMSQAVYGLSQALASGTVRAEEFNQVFEPLGGLAAEVERVLRLGQGELRKLVNEGKLSSDALRQALIEALRPFEGAAAQGATTLTAEMTRFGNEVRNAGASIVSDLLGPLASAVREANNLARVTFRRPQELTDVEIQERLNSLTGVNRARREQELRDMVTGRRPRPENNWLTWIGTYGPAGLAARGGFNAAVALGLNEPTRNAEIERLQIEQITRQNEADMAQFNARFGQGETTAYQLRLIGEVQGTTQVIQRELGKLAERLRTERESIEEEWRKTNEELARVAREGGQAVEGQVEAARRLNDERRARALEALERPIRERIDSRITGAEEETAALQRQLDVLRAFPGTMEDVQRLLDEEAAVRRLIAQLGREATDADRARAAEAVRASQQIQQELRAEAALRDANREVSESAADLRRIQSAAEAARRAGRNPADAVRETEARIRDEQRFRRSGIDLNTPEAARLLDDLARIRQERERLNQSIREGAGAARQAASEAERLAKQQAEAVRSYVSARQFEASILEEEIRMLRERGDIDQPLLDQRRAEIELRQQIADLQMRGINLTEEEISQMRGATERLSALNAERERVQRANRILDQLDPGRATGREVRGIRELQERGDLTPEQAAQAMQQSQERLLSTLASQGRAIRIEWEQIADTLLDAATGAQSFDDAIRSIARTIASQGIRIAMNNLFGNGSGLNLWLNRSMGLIPGSAFGGEGGGGGGFLSGLFGGGGSGGGFFSSLLSGIGGLFGFGGVRAEGGPVMAGVPYLVGERGPEPFVPRVPGYVISAEDARAALAGGARRSGRAGGPMVVVNIQTPDASSFRASQGQIAARLGDAVMRGQLLR